MHEPEGQRQGDRCIRHDLTIDTHERRLNALNGHLASIDKALADMPRCMDEKFGGVYSRINDVDEKWTQIYLEILKARGDLPPPPPPEKGGDSEAVKWASDRTEKILYFLLSAALGVIMYLVGRGVL